MKIIYTFICSNCQFEFESLQEMKDYKSLKKCPECKQNQLYRNYAADSVSASVKLNDAEITVGHLASRNRSRFSQDKKDHLNKKHNEHNHQDINELLPEGMKQKVKPTERPWYHSDNEEKIAKMTTEEQKRKYIETGEI
jgi:putative FmdB family regulatory protein